MAHRPLRRVPPAKNIYMRERTNNRIYSDIKQQNTTAEEPGTEYVGNVQAGANTIIYSDTKPYDTTAPKLKPETKYVLKKSASIITTPNEFVQFYSSHKEGYGKFINKDFHIHKDVNGGVDKDRASNDKNNECTDKENIDCIKKEGNESMIEDNDFHNKDKNNPGNGEKEDPVNGEKEDYDSLFDGLSLSSTFSSCNSSSFK